MFLAIPEFCWMGCRKVKREEYTERIAQAREEIKTAGVIHRKDLIRYIKRLEKEAKIYDFYQKGVSRHRKERLVCGVDIR